MMRSQKAEWATLSTSAKSRRVCRFVAWPIAALLASTAVAQSAVEREQMTAQGSIKGRKQGMLEEIVVTAQRRAESIQDVAIGMSAVTADDLARQGITNFEDLNRAVAGLHAEAHSGFSSASVRLRGVGTGGFTIVDPSVGVVIDGIFQPRVATAFSDLMGVERIEVLRGPQGTLFGKNTTAGVINIVTKRPDTRETSGRLEVTGGNLKNAEARAALNIPLLEDTLGLRLSGYNVEREGHNTNKFRDRDTRGENRYGFRAKLLFTPTENLDIYLIGDYKKTDTDIDASLARYGTYDNRTSPGSIPAPVPPPNDPQGRPLEEVAAEQGKPLPPVSKFSGEVFEDATHAVRDIFTNGTLQIDWRIPGHTLTSLTGYQEVDEDFSQDSDGTLLDLMRLEIAIDTQTWTQELRIASDSAEGNFLDYVVGAFYQQEKPSTVVFVFDGDDAAAIEGREKRPVIPVMVDTETETLAGFGHLTFHLSESWEAVAGVRYTTSDKSADSTLFLDIGFPANLAVPPTNVALIPDLSETYEETTFTAKLKHYFAADKMLYLSLDRGFKTGGFNLENVTCPLDPATCVPEELKQYDPELTDSAEIGWKTEWLDRRLRLNGAVFYQTYEDFQVNVANPRGSSALVSNASDVTSQGVELDFAAAIASRWLLNGSLAWIEATYDKYDNAPCATTQSKDAGCTQDLSGKRLDNSPEWTANLGIEYTVPFWLSEKLDWFARGDAAYRSDTFLLASQAADSEQEAYTVYGARTGLRQIEGRWNAQIWVNNLSDEDYGVVISRPALHIDGLNVVRGLPRTFGVSAEFTF